jgi:hypothetical protein
MMAACALVATFPCAEAARAGTALMAAVPISTEAEMLEMTAFLVKYISFISRT